jgi:hypothetical protein
MTVYSLVTKRGCGGRQHVHWVSRPAGPRRHWSPTLGNRVRRSSCSPPVALASGGLGCCWRWEPGSGGPRQSKAREACPQRPGHPQECPYRPFCPCPLAGALGLESLRVGVALKVPPPVHDQGHWEAHPQLPWDRLCPNGVLEGLGWSPVPAGGAHRPAPSGKCVLQLAAGSGLEVPGAGGRAGSKGGQAYRGRAPCERRAGASVAS